MPVIIPPPRPRETIIPDGTQSWPFIGLAGVDHSGKTIAIARFSSSPLIGRCLLITLGEGDANAYGAVPGARYEIVPHDGSYKDILAAVVWAVNEPRVDGKPVGIAFDGGTELRDMLTSEQALITYERIVQKARKYNKRVPVLDEVSLTSDQHNVVKDRWKAITGLLKAHDGPAIMTVLLEDVSVMDAAGNPTKEKMRKWQGHKSLPKTCDVKLELRSEHARNAVLTGWRGLPPGLSDDAGTEVIVPDWSIDKVLRMLGLSEGTVTKPQLIMAARPEAYLQEHAEETEAALAAEQETSQRREAADRGELPSPERLMDEISAALNSGNARSALLRLRAGYGASALEQVQVRLRNGRVCNGDAAILAAIEHVRTQGAPEAATPAAPPAAPEQSTEAAPEPAPAAPAAASGRWHPVDAMRAELEYQARLQGQTVDAYAEQILRRAGAISVGDLTPEHIGMVGPWLVIQRERAINILKGRGDADGAAVYAQAKGLNDFLPRDMLQRLLTGPQEDAPAPAAAVEEPTNA